MRRREFLKLGGAGLVFGPTMFRWPEAFPVVGEPQWRQPVRDIEKQLPGLMEAHSVPGCSVAVIWDAKLAWRRGFGCTNAATRSPVTTETIFEAASMSKPVFAYTAVKLCERGLLGLDTPLTKYTQRRFLEGDPRLDLITARHVLSHTTGFQNWRSDKKPLGIDFTPGEKWQYSGEGYNYLQTVVAQLTHEPFEPCMRTRLLKPFGMSASGYEWNEMFENRMAQPHDKQGKTQKNKKSTAADVARYGSAGALLTTPSDYAKFLIEVVDPKPADNFRLNTASLAEMLRPQVKVMETPEYTIAWGLGWRLAQSRSGESSFGHGGDNEGFHCISVASLAKKSGVVIMTNGENGAKLIGELFAGELMKPFA